MECKKDRNLVNCQPAAFHTNVWDALGNWLCCFPDDAERSWDRSFEHSARLVTERKV